MEDEHESRRGLAGQGGAVHGEGAVETASGRIAAGEGQLSFVGSGAGQAEGRLDGVLHLGTADQLGDQPAHGIGVEAEDPVGAGIGEQEPPASVDGDHGLGHRPQDHEQLLAVLIQPRGPGLDLGRRRVEGVDQPPDRPPTLGQDQARLLPIARAPRAPS